MWPQDNIVAASGVALRQVVAAHGVAEVEPV
jgi:lipoate-protein ligase B